MGFFILETRRLVDTLPWIAPMEMLSRLQPGPFIVKGWEDKKQQRGTETRGSKLVELWELGMENFVRPVKCWNRLDREILRPSSLRSSKIQLDKTWYSLIASNFFVQEFRLETYSDCFHLELFEFC